MIFKSQNFNFLSENDKKIKQIYTLKGINKRMGHDKIIDRDGKEVHLDIILHPGYILADELKERNIHKSAMAVKLGIYPSYFNNIVKGNRNITANIALKLESETGIGADFWLHLQMDYDLNIRK